MRFLRSHSSLPVTLLTGTMLGSTLVVSRFSLGQFATPTYVAVRLLVASLAFLAAYSIFRVRPWPRSPRLWATAGVYGLIGTALTMSAYTRSLLYQSSGITALLSTLSPIETALLAHFFLHDEPFSRKRLVGALIAFAGAGLLLIRGESGLAEMARADWRGYAWALLGGLSNSAAVVFARRYLRGEDPFVLSSIRVMVGTAAVCIITAFGAGYDLSRVQASGVAAVLYAGIAGTFLAFLAYQQAIQRFGATEASQSEYFIPMIATGLGVLLLGEQVTLAMLAGMVLIILGLMVFDKGKVKNHHEGVAVPGPVEA